ncbi:MAG TPA: glycosyltransferase domain-containing protein [Rudaea sp.]|nr:glycosyltransferase domain-containing protein [Rudaea sp.]
MLWLTDYLRPSAVAEANPLFDAEWYLARNPDVAADGGDPWEHFLGYGAAEGRDPNPLFDCRWYVAQYRDLRLRLRRMNPLLHYWRYGAARGYDPNPLFDSDWYLERNPEVAAAGTNPLLHYLRQGADEGRDPSALFDSAWYRRSNPGLRTDRLTPLGDYLRYGLGEGRTCRRPPTPAEMPSVPHSIAGRIAVYTSIVGAYDTLKLPRVVDPRCDYFCFTDHDISWQNVWTRREIVWRHADPVRTARHVKHNPHLYFPDHEWSIWLDANLELAASPLALVPEGDWQIALWSHPYRDCLYAEAAQCILEKKDDPTTIRAQIERYRQAGMPEHVGLHECCTLVRRHNDPALVAFAHAWWDEIERGSRRDQLSFDFAAWKHGLRVSPLGGPGSNVRHDARVRFYSHVQPRHAR